MIKIATRLGIPLLALSLMGTSVGMAESRQNGSEPVPPLAESDDVRVGQGVVCDTSDQIERVASLLGRAGDSGNAVKVVNAEVGNPIACAMIQAAFVQGAEVAKVRADNQVLSVVEITILAVPVEGAWQYVTPVKQYTALPAEGVEI